MRTLKIILGLSVLTLSCVAEPGDTAEVNYVESSETECTGDAGLPDLSQNVPAMTSCPDAGK